MEFNHLSRPRWKLCEKVLVRIKGGEIIKGEVVSIPNGGSHKYRNAQVKLETGAIRKFDIHRFNENVRSMY